MKDQPNANRLKRDVVIWLAILASLYIGCRIDAALNPWLQSAEFRWWNLLTTQHYLPWLSLHQPVAFGVMMVVLSLFWTVIIAWSIRCGKLKLGMNN